MFCIFWSYSSNNCGLQNRREQKNWSKTIRNSSSCALAAVVRLVSRRAINRNPGHTTRRGSKSFHVCLLLVEWGRRQKEMNGEWTVWKAVGLNYATGLPPIITDSNYIDSARHLEHLVWLIVRIRYDREIDMEDIFFFFFWEHKIHHLLLLQLQYCW